MPRRSKAIYRGRPRRALAERTQLAESFVRTLERGVNAKTAAKEVGAPLASLYRWVAAAWKTEHAAIPQSAMVDIDDTLGRLVTLPILPRLEQIETIIRFMIWLRAPTEPKHHDIKFFIYLAAYARQKSEATTLSDIEPILQAAVARAFKFDLLNHMCLWDDLDPPDFDQDDLYYDVFTKWDALAEVTAFLVRQPKRIPGKRAGPSLMRAWRLLRNGSLKYTWKISRSTFDSFWSRNAPAAPFAYAHVFKSKLDFPWDPRSPTFANDLDAVADEHGLLKKLIVDAFSVVESLAAVLDPRSAARIHFRSAPMA